MARLSVQVPTRNATAPGRHGSNTDEWEGDEVAAAVVNTICTHENEATCSRRGWLESVFTRRAWRRRGLASALIARSLRVLAERGMETAMLGVDADNPSGALRLYESFGFAVTERGQAWRKPMEEIPR